MRYSILLTLSFGIHSSLAAISSGSQLTSSIFDHDPTGLILPRQVRCNEATDKQCTIPNPVEGQSDKFCCPSSTDCVLLANGSSGICCKTGSTCGRVTAVPCNTDFSIRQTQEQCGSDIGQCCPTFYTCRSGMCVLREENWPGLPEGWLDVVRFAGSAQQRNCSGEVEVALARAKSEENQYPIKPILIGLFPGLAAGAFIMFVVCYAVQLRQKRKRLYTSGSDQGFHEHKLMEFPEPKSIDSRATSRNTTTTLHNSRSYNNNSAASGSRSHPSPGPRQKPPGPFRAPPSAVTEESRSHGNPSPHPSQASRRSRRLSRPQLVNVPGVPQIRTTPPPSGMSPPQPQNNNLPGLYIPNPQSARTSVSTSTDSTTSSFQESTISHTQARNEMLYAKHMASSPPPIPPMPSTPNRLAVLHPVSSTASYGGGPADARSVLTDNEEYGSMERRRLEQAYRLSTGTGGKVDRWAKEKAPKPGSGY